MNVGILAEPNSKGQIVIPKKIRDQLNINENTLLNIIVKDNGIYLYPVVDVTTTKDAEISRNKLMVALERTRGLWADDKDFDKRQRIRRKIELAASRKRKKAWW